MSENLGKYIKNNLKDRIFKLFEFLRMNLYSKVHLPNALRSLDYGMDCGSRILNRMMFIQESGHGRSKCTPGFITVRAFILGAE